MSTSMRARAEDYLEMRRSLGFKLRGEGRMLAGFAARCDEQGQATITISAALAWATESTRCRSSALAPAAERGARIRPVPGHRWTRPARSPRLTCSPRRRTGRRRTSTPPRRSRRSSTPPGPSARPCQQRPCRR